VNISNQNIVLEKMRSYSSVFSGRSFFELIQYDDYSFIDDNIEKFDSSKIGKNINTYFDYLAYIYRELRKQYRSEYIYKNTLINEVLLKKYGLRNTLAINEFRVGDSIADIVMFNGTSKAFEIKTELDSDKRLEGQLADYTKIFKQCYIVTHESLVDKYIKEDSSIGIIKLIERPRSVVMEEIRPALENESIDVDTLIASVRTQEYLNIVKAYFNDVPEMNSFNMFEKCRDLMKEIPTERLNELFISEIKKRKSNVGNLSMFPRELRQLCLSMNLNIKQYDILEDKLEKTINLNL